MSSYVYFERLFHYHTTSRCYFYFLYVWTRAAYNRNLHCIYIYINLFHILNIFLRVIDLKSDFLLCRLFFTFLPYFASIVQILMIFCWWKISTLFGNKDFISRESPILTDFENIIEFENFHLQFLTFSFSL